MVQASLEQVVRSSPNAASMPSCGNRELRRARWFGVRHDPLLHRAQELASLRQDELAHSSLRVLALAILAAIVAGVSASTRPMR